MTSAIPQQRVEFPIANPDLGIGLYANASLIDVPRGVSGGVEVEVPRLGGHGLWDQTCTPLDDNEVKHGGDTPAVRRFPGTGVWALDDCGPVGSTMQDSRDAAVQTLRRTEPVDVEKFVAPVLLEQAVPSTSLAAAVTMFSTEGMLPVIHIAPSMLEELVTRRVAVQQGKLWRHVLGGVLAVGAGYEGLLTNPIVTGPVVVYRSAVVSYESFDPSTNQRVALAERTASVAWAGPAVEVTL